MEKKMKRWTVEDDYLLSDYFLHDDIMNDKLDLPPEIEFSDAELERQAEMYGHE